MDDAPETAMRAPLKAARRRACGGAAGLGLVEGFGPGAMMVRSPAAIAQDDLAADLAAEGGAQTLARRLDQRLATFKRR